MTTEKSTIPSSNIPQTTPGTEPTNTGNARNTAHPHGPALQAAYGPALQAAVAKVNEAFIELCITAARMGKAEPLSPALLGMSRALLDELADEGRARMLMSHAYGLPLVELRIKDPAVLRHVISEGFGSPQAIAEITKTMPLEIITKIKRRT